VIEAASLSPARTREHARARRHTRLVRVLRRAIPFGSGLAIVVYLALGALNPLRKINAEVTLGPVAVSGTKVTMENPRLTGYRKEGRPYEVTAAAALQDVRKPTLVELKQLRGRLATDDNGGVARIEALSGFFDTAKEHLDLKDDIRLWTEAGQEMRLRSAAVDFKAGTVRSSEPVSVAFPEGTVEAQSLEVADNGKTLSFVGRVQAVFSGEPARGTAPKAKPAKPILTSSADAERIP
jgi:lipopolysaccharide export system protein LptC